MNRARKVAIYKTTGSDQGAEETSHTSTRQWWELDSINSLQDWLVSCSPSCEPHIVIEVARKSLYCLCLEDPTSHLLNTLPWHIPWWQLPKCVYGLLRVINIVEGRDNFLWPPVKDPYNEPMVSVTISAAFITTVVFTHSTKTKQCDYISKKSPEDIGPPIAIDCRNLDLIVIKLQVVWI